ncbi:hypothetical protein [Actinokineospora enzanensis]|uniref:hypothetical protein n=1 Tax=Actinokineospora enzanensis TaxID=155975 RepID=UPI000367946B|nr:hypothetical protein [Actinokineospora enzanensis]
MGFFGQYVYDGTGWHNQDDWDGSTQPEVWLTLDIFDSDVASVRYHPNGSGAGVAYLGHTPRSYFDDPDASEPTDVPREAAGLAAWWAARSGGDAAGKVDEIAGFLAGDDDLDDDLDDADDGEDAEDDDADIFVEIKAARFLAALDLPLPQDLQD